MVASPFVLPRYLRGDEGKLTSLRRNEEVAQYLATFKAYEHKSADTLKERVHQSYHEQLQHALTSGRKVNKTDADNLASQFGVRLRPSVQKCPSLSLTFDSHSLISLANPPRPWRASRAWERPRSRPWSMRLRNRSSSAG